MGMSSIQGGLVMEGHKEKLGTVQKNIDKLKGCSYNWKS